MIQELLYVTDYRNLPINMDRCSFKRPCICSECYLLIRRLVVQSLHAKEGLGMFLNLQHAIISS